MEEIILAIHDIPDVEVKELVRRIDIVRGQTGLDLDHFLNAVARYVAHEYHHERISFDVADHVMNRLFWSAAMTFGAPSREVPGHPPYMWSVFFAFDAGEGYREGDSRDIHPAERYTRPRIARIVAQDISAEPSTAADAPRG
jgi:hypothetical protein